MRFRSPRLLWAVGASAAIASCSVYGPDLLLSQTTMSTGGAGGATSSSSTSTSSSTTSSSTTSSSGGRTSPALVLSQVKTRGLGGGTDEWVEIYNPGSAPVTFDGSWSVAARTATGGLAGCATVIYTTRFSGGGQVIPSHGHILYGYPTGFSEAATTPADAPYAVSVGISDAASVVLVHGATVIDALCFYYDSATTRSTRRLEAVQQPFTCSGTPVMNLHDNTTASDNNQSLERKPGGAGGNTMNTHDNASDFIAQATADPHDLTSVPVP